MILIFNGPTPITTAASGDQKAIRRDAGELKALVEAQSLTVEVAPTVQERQAGLYTLTLTQETAAERHARKLPATGLNFTFDAANDFFANDALESFQTAESRGSHTVRVSPVLVKAASAAVTISDFPTTTKFGNGVTANSKITLTDGTNVTVSWVVLAEGTTVSDGVFSNLQTAFEG